MKRENILVTGGAGFIGCNFIRHILNKYENYNIINFDKLTYAGKPENLADVCQDKRYSFIKGDISNREDVEQAMQGIDYVVHFAAESHVDRSITGPEIFTITNVLGTQILLDYAKANNIKKSIS